MLIGLAFTNVPDLVWIERHHAAACLFRAGFVQQMRDKHSWKGVELIEGVARLMPPEFVQIVRRTGDLEMKRSTAMMVDKGRRLKKGQARK